MILPRRKFLTGLAATLIAAPAIVRASSLMPVKALKAWPESFIGLDPLSEYRKFIIFQGHKIYFGSICNPASFYVTAAEDEKFVGIANPSMHPRIIAHNGELAIEADMKHLFSKVELATNPSRRR